ncbi:hypothetical protein J1TS1_13600 [Shouchella clausii]|nr:hypothetical protein J1TS1_13600 [Shouchella clausii]
MPYQGSIQPGLCGGHVGGVVLLEAGADKEKLKSNASTLKEAIRFFIDITSFPFIMSYISMKRI